MQTTAARAIASGLTILECTAVKSSGLLLDPLNSGMSSPSESMMAARDSIVAPSWIWAVCNTRASGGESAITD
jgi:hypothetical protein